MTLSIATAAAKPFWTPDYSAEKLKRDAIAGLTVAAISLPEGMAYGLLAGVDPRYGLYAAIVFAIVASIFSSSSHLVNGPTSAIALVVFTALAHFDPDQRAEAAEAMFLLGFMIGSIQVLIAIFRLGDLTRYISETVILGFMAAASVILALGQVANALGLHSKGNGHQHILHRLWLTLTQGDAINIRAVLVTVATLVIALTLRALVRRYKLPRFDMLVSLLLVAGGAYLIGWTIPGADGKPVLHVPGVIPRSLPAFHIPDIKLSWVSDFASDSFAIAFLGLLEALAIAKSISFKTKQPIDFNRQCLAEGLANLVGGFFQCLPGSGSLSRSAINYQAGAATRFSGFIAAVLVAIAILLFAPLSRYVPTAALAALLLLTAARLFDVDRIRYVLRAGWIDAGTFVVTAVAGLAFGLDIAILIGIAVSILLFVPRAARLKVRELTLDQNNVVRDRLASDPRRDGFLIYDLEGELFFGAAPELERCLRRVEQDAKAVDVEHVLLRLKRVRHPDVVSLELLEHFLKQSEAEGIKVWLSGLQPDLLAAFDRLEFERWLPRERQFASRYDDNSSTIEAIDKIRAALTPTQAGRARAELSYQA